MLMIVFLPLLVCLPRGVADCSQNRIDHGELIRWTKGFGAPNIEGRDVAAMFSDSLKRLVRQQTN
jgi:hypothetical protein